MQAAPHDRNPTRARFLDKSTLLQLGHGHIHQQARPLIGRHPLLVGILIRKTRSTFSCNKLLSFFGKHLGLVGFFTSFRQHSSCSAFFLGLNTFRASTSLDRNSTSRISLVLRGQGSLILTAQCSGLLFLLATFARLLRTSILGKNL